MKIDRDRLAKMLRNEADMAAKRRIQTVIEYLDLEPGKRILDCGCGLGWMTKFFTELGASQVLASDLDRQRLARAQAELGSAVPFTAADILRLPYRDACFDGIALSEVLEHLADDRGALAEVRRVLKPGGVLAITVPNAAYPFLWDPINWLREHTGRAPIRAGVFGGLWTDHLRLYTRRQIVDLVEGSDLIVEEVRELVHFCFPFAHNLVYGLGKSLVESGWLRNADRFRFAENSGSPLNPINWGLALFSAIDRFNHPISDTGKSTVILAVKARKR